MEQKISDDLRARAELMRRGGFTPAWGSEYGGPYCFWCAGIALRGDGLVRNPSLGDEFLRRTIFGGDGSMFYERRLREGRWGADDAIAALEIAADIAEAEGK